MESEIYKSKKDEEIMNALDWLEEQVEDITNHMDFINEEFPTNDDDLDMLGTFDRIRYDSSIATIDKVLEWIKNKKEEYKTCLCTEPLEPLESNQKVEKNSMSIELKKFHLVSDNKEVYVNPSKVVFVTRTDYNETTITLDFGTLAVSEKCDKVVDELTKSDRNS